MVEFNKQWNEDYDFIDPKNKSLIEDVESYDLSNDPETYAPGQNIESPWGSNQVVQVWEDKGIEYCKKKITINPGHMLSLQRHRGREEDWIVSRGILTVICNGKKYEVSAGENISIPLAAPHCMINVSQNIVEVEEIQKGICREKDNIRLIDFAKRPTYPLTSEIEYRSSIIYNEIADSMQHIEK